MFTRLTSPELRNARRDLINASYPRKQLGAWYPTAVLLAVVVAGSAVGTWIESIVL